MTEVEFAGLALLAGGIYYLNAIVLKQDLVIPPTSKKSTEGPLYSRFAPLIEEDQRRMADNDGKEVKYYRQTINETKHLFL